MAGRAQARRVFLSHTSELREFPRERSFIAAAEAAVIRTGNAVTDMTYFTARDLQPADSCRNMVTLADIYVGIIGLRYGSVVRDRPDVSYTELEFEAATTCGLPRLVFLLDEHAELPLPADRIVDREYGHRQDAFRHRLQEASVTVATVASPNEMETRLYQALVEAESAFRDLLEALRRVLGPDHPNTLTTFSRMADAVGGQGRWGEAEEMYREVLPGRTRVHGDNHTHVFGTRHGLAVAVARQGRWDEAEAMFRELLDAQRAALGDDHPHTRTTQRLLTEREHR